MPANLVANLVGSLLQIIIANLVPYLPYKNQIWKPGSGKFGVASDLFPSSLVIALGSGKVSS